MCGRYVVAYDPQDLVDGFSLVRVQPFPRRWNVAPTAMVPVVYETREGERIGELMRWGLVPHWAADASGGARMNNARAEGVGDKPSFRQAVRKRRCLIPASGYYEWQTRPGPDGKPQKQPFYISPAGGTPFFAFAGLFEAWRPKGSGEDAPWLLTCSIVTTSPGPALAPIHDRMPVLVEPDDWAAWLSRERAEPEHWGPLLRTAADERVQAWPVDRAVGRSTTEGPQLVAPIDLAGWGEGCGTSTTPIEPLG
jgi:putative SOS response-associated peptidase YedK